MFYPLLWAQCMSYPYAGGSTPTTFAYNDLLFHIFTDHYRSMMEYIRECLSMYIKDNKESVEIISAEFLGCKGLSVDDYVENISKPFNHGDVLGLHLLARMGTFKLQLLGIQVFGTPILQSQMILHPLPLIASWFIWEKHFQMYQKKNKQV